MDGEPVREKSQELEAPQIQQNAEQRPGLKAGESDENLFKKDLRFSCWRFHGTAQLLPHPTGEGSLRGLLSEAV